MNAEQYYARNVLLHGQSLPQVESHDYVSLPSVPSEADYALFWLSREGITGAILDVGCAGLDLLIKAERIFRQRCGVDIVSLPAWEKYPEINASTCNLDNANLP